MTRYSILSLDGGGIRGIIQAIILERLEHLHPGFISRIDLFAGTSTGGLVALGLAYGLTPTQLIELYEQLGPVVFSDTVIDDVRDLGTLVGADYQIGPLKDVLDNRFGGIKLGQLERKVLISAFDLDNEDPQKARRTWKAKFFHNFAGSDSDEDELVVDVGIRTCVAPTYFPIYQGYIDGGVVATNPSVCALAQALHPETGGRKMKDIALFSISTGHNPRYITSQDGDWGLLQWAPHIVNLTLEGGAGLADYQCRQFLGEKYHRLNVMLPEPIGMDRVDRISELKRIARQNDIRTASTWLDNYLV
jgi:patatin-like phospholipase/acyl hydrolase